MNVREMRRFPAKWRDNKLHHTKILLPLLFIRVYIFSFQLHSFYIHLFHAVYPRMYFVNDNNISNDLTLNEIRSKKVELRTRPKRTYPSIKNTEGSLNVTLHVYTLVFKFLNHRALSKYKNQSPRPIQSPIISRLIVIYPLFTLLSRKLIVTVMYTWVSFFSFPRSFHFLSSSPCPVSCEDSMQENVEQTRGHLTPAVLAGSFSSIRTIICNALRNWRGNAMYTPHVNVSPLALAPSAAFSSASYPPFSLSSLL